MPKRRPSNPSLAGRVVAAIGLPYDDWMLQGVELVVRAGARVALFDLGEANDDHRDVTTRVPAGDLAAGSGGSIVLVSTLNGRHVRRHLWDVDDPWEAIFNRVEDEFEALPDTVWLGRWWGFVDAGVVPGVLERLRQTGGRELVASEAPEPADQVVRWLARWRDTDDPVDVMVVREPASAPGVPTNAGGVGKMLLSAGWTEVTLEEADRAAAERRGGWRDALAGSCWALVGNVGVDRPQVVVGDVASVKDAGAEALGRVTEPYEIADLRQFGVSGLLVRLPGEDAYGVAATPPEGPVRAVCLQGVADVFEHDVAYRPMGILDIGSGAVTFRSVEAVLGGSEGVDVPLEPGRWAVEVARGDGETWAIRLRPFVAADVNEFPDWDDSSTDVVDFDDWGDPIYWGDSVVGWSDGSAALFPAGDTDPEDGTTR